MDAVTKALLPAIAVGLWVNAAQMMRPAHAFGPEDVPVQKYLDQMQIDL